MPVQSGPSERDTLLDEFRESGEVEGVTNESTEEAQSVSQADGQGTVDAPNTSALLEELSNFEGDIGLAELKRFAEAAGEKYTDEELEKMWQEAQSPKVSAPRQYKFYKGDEELSSLDGLSAEQLLELSLGYKAMGQDQRRSLDELVRIAQFGHFNEQRIQQLLNERNTSQGKYQETASKVSEYEKREQLTQYAITQHIQGNSQPLLQLIEAFKNVQQAPPSFVQSQAQPDEYQMQAAAQQVYYETVVPNAQRLASEYGANAQEIAAVIVAMADNEGEFLTPERLDQIMNQELPYMLEQKGYSTTPKPEEAPKVEPKDEEIMKLKAELAKLSAGKKNAIVQAVKSRKAPPSGGGATPSAGDTMPEIKDRHSMKEYLRS